MNIKKKIENIKISKDGKEWKDLEGIRKIEEDPADDVNCNYNFNANCNSGKAEFTYLDTHYGTICDFCLKKYQCEIYDKDLVLTCKYYEACLID